MTPRLMKLLLALLLVALAACRAPVASDDPLDGTSWRLAELQYSDRAEPGDGGALAFRDGEVWFQPDCNTCSAAYTFVDGILSIGAEATCTEMACDPDEHARSTVLNGPMRVTMEGERLTLRTAGGGPPQPTLVFDRADD